MSLVPPARETHHDGIAPRRACDACSGTGTVFHPPYTGADPALCLAVAPIRPGDTGPTHCRQHAGHDHPHHGTDPDSYPPGRDRAWDDRDTFQTAHRTCEACGGSGRWPPDGHLPTEEALPNT